MAVAAKSGLRAQPASALDAAALFERHGDQIYHYCVGRLRNREEAADAVQNTFLRVHMALERGVVPRFESAWLYKIAHNVCLSRIEAHGRRARIETPRDLDALDESALAAPATEHEALAGLGEALADLPPRVRQAILLREWQGLSHADIAAVMNTTVPAVETLLCRARKQLAAALEQGGRRVRIAVAGVLDLLTLRGFVSRHASRHASRSSGLLSGPGVTKLAIGAVLAAVGASGVGVAVVVGNDSAPSGRTVLAALTGGASPFQQVDAGSYLFSALSLDLRDPALTTVAASTSTPGAAAPGESGTASRTGSTSGGAPTGGAPTGSAPLPTLPAGLPLPSTDLVLSTPTLPTVPTLSTPSLTVPTVPTVSAPVPTLPTVSAPIPTTPTVTAPQLTTPTLSTPTVTVPGLGP